jgi:ankyrin repeat protein
MCTYAAMGLKEQLEDLLNGGVDVNTGDYDKRTALHLAASEGHTDVVDCLIKRGANVNATDRMGFSPLVDACRHGHLKVQKLLREAGGQVLGIVPTASAPSLSGYEMGVLLCTYAALGWKDQLMDVLKNGVSPDTGDYDKRTALHLAASEGHTDVVEALIMQGANVNATDRMGFSPLVDACRHNHHRIQNLLRDAGGQVLGMDEAVVIAEEKQRDGSASFKSAKPRPVSAPRGRSTTSKPLNGNTQRAMGSRAASLTVGTGPMFQHFPKFRGPAPEFATPPAAFGNPGPLFSNSRLF